MRKFLLPPRGLFTKNLRDSVDGAHAVPHWKTLAAFAHPRNPKIFRIASALIASGKEIFSFDSLTSFNGTLKNGQEGRGERTASLLSIPYAVLESREISKC